MWAELRALPFTLEEPHPFSSQALAFFSNFYLSLCENQKFADISYIAHTIPQIFFFFFLASLNVSLLSKVTVKLPKPFSDHLLFC